MEEKKEILKMQIMSTMDDDFQLKQEEKLFKCYEKANTIKNRILSTTKNDIISAKRQLVNLENNLKKEWPALFEAEADKIYIHIDFDSFYASCETLKNPKLKDIPIGIGSTLMLATANYEARKYGVKAGMPGYLAKRLCPQLTIVPTNFSRYNFYSDKLMEILALFDKHVEIYGIDEACISFNPEKLIETYSAYKKLILTEYIKEDKEFLNFFNESEIHFNYQNVEYIVEKIRNVVYQKTGLTVSAGISICRGLAKFCSNVNKPNGQYTLKEKFKETLMDLKVDELNGIGKYTKEMLHKTFQIKTIKDMKEKMHLLYIVLTEKTFICLFRLSYGLSIFDDEKVIENLKINKSRAKDKSFVATNKLNDILDIMWDLSCDLSITLKKKTQNASLLTLRFRYDNFESKTKQKKLSKPIYEDFEIFNQALELLKEIFCKESNDKIYKSFDLPRKINLFGLRVSSLNKYSKNSGILKYKIDSQKYIKRNCPVCNKIFFMEPQFFVEIHVEKCLKKINKIEKQKTKKNLTHFLVKK